MAEGTIDYVAANKKRTFFGEVDVGGLSSVGDAQDEPRQKRRRVLGKGVDSDYNEAIMISSEKSPTPTIPQGTDMPGRPARLVAMV